MPKHLIFGDGHLADRSWAKKEIIGDSYFAARQIGDIAIAEECASVISAGDLIDQVKNFSRPIAVLGKLISRLRKKEIDFNYILGQHDLADPPWPASFPGATHIDKKAIRLGEFWAYGLDYRHPDDLLVELSCIPEKVSILIAHQAWDECKAAMAPSQASAKKDLPAHVNMLFTGDYHITLQKKVKRADKDPVWVMSSGSTCLQSTNEPNQKNVFLFDDQSGDVTVHPLKSRHVIRSEPIQDEQALEDFVEMLPDLVKKFDRSTIEDENVCIPLVIARVGKSVKKADSILRKVCSSLDAFCIVGTIKPQLVKTNNTDEEGEPVRLEATPQNVRQFLQAALKTVFTPEEAEASKLCNDLVLAKPTEEGTREVLTKWWEERQTTAC